MQILIFGNGGHARVVADTTRAMVGVAPIGFVFSGPVSAADSMMGLRIYSEESISESQHDSMVIGLGDNRQRRNIYGQYNRNGEIMATVIHPSAIIAPDVAIEPGCLICAGVIINTGARIQANTILNTGCIVDHDCTIGPHAHIAPGVSMAGRVTVEEGGFVGIGAQVVQNITIGAWATIGAGAAVIRDVRPETTVVGVPAREM